jgi:hypothetical protein
MMMELGRWDEAAERLADAPHMDTVNNAELVWLTQAREALSSLGAAKFWRDSIAVVGAAIELVAAAFSDGEADEAWHTDVDQWHALFLRDDLPAPVEDRYAATAAADVARSRGDDASELWRSVIERWGDDHYMGAKAKWRLAEALLALDPANAESPLLLADAEATAVTLGAKPLLKAVRRAQATIGE